METNDAIKTTEEVLISIVISLYNEEDAVFGSWLGLKNELTKLKGLCFELIWVNDGSNDQTQQIIDEKVIKNTTHNIDHCTIEFSKNFGHEAAMIAGIDHAKGKAIICMDADGQHPPSELPKMIASFLSGTDYVLMERTRREDNGFLKELCSALFYKTINKLSSVKFRHSASDFFLVSRQVAENLKSHYREQNRFIRGYIQSIGFCCEVFPFEAPGRVNGKSHYSYVQLMKLALGTIFAFSNKPLRISILFSVLFIVFTLLFGAYTLYMFVYGNSPPSGYTSIILLLTFSFSMLFLTITILSLYFEKAIQEMRHRPIYIIKRIKFN